MPWAAPWMVLQWHTAYKWFVSTDFDPYNLSSLLSTTNHRKYQGRILLKIPFILGLSLGLSLFKAYIKSRSWWFVGIFAKIYPHFTHIFTTLVFCRFLPAYPSPQVLMLMQEKAPIKLCCFMPAGRKVSVFTLQILKHLADKNPWTRVHWMYFLVGSPV